MNADGEKPGESGEFRFPRAARITKSDEIRALFRRGKRRRTRHLDVLFSASPVAHSRLGIVVPKHRQTAVRRNRVKRRLREIGRTILLPRLRAAPSPLDLMLRARPEAYEASYAELRDQLAALVEELCSRSR